MKLKVKRLDKKLQLPKYEPGAAGFDFVCRADVKFKPGEIKPIPANVAIQVPKGYVIFIIPRSSTPNKYGLSMPHSIGVLDPFYSGEDNEVVLLFQNFSNKTATVKRGSKIAQGVLIKTEHAQLQEVSKLGRSRIKGTWKV
jgi:dUTP pyrophosphatase